MTGPATTGPARPAPGPSPPRGDPGTAAQPGPPGDPGPALVIGGYGVGNVGDEAILAGLLQEQPDLQDAVVVSYDPGHTRRLHGVRAVSPLSPAFPAALHRAGRVVIGGGGLFSAYTGPLARGIPWAAILAQALRKPVEFHAIGAYPGTPPITARVLARAAERAERLSVRDASSEAYLRRLGVRRRIERVPDPALRLAPVPRHQVAALLQARAPRALGRCVVFGVRRLKDRRAGPHVERALAGVTAALLDHGVEPLFVPFSAHPYEHYADDRRLARDLVRAAGGGSILEGEIHPRVVLGVVRHSTCVVAMRLHAMLFALSAGRPLVPIPYDAKCTDALAERGLRGPSPGKTTALALLDGVEAALRGSPPAHPAPPGAADPLTWPPADGVEVPGRGGGPG